jgi:DNA topoisomerase-1
MPRLRRSSPDQSGWTRRRRGRGFAYLDSAGERIDDPVALDRLRSLAIPPAWRDVWICPHPNGHLQAVGTDDRGRRQYLYHRQWRLQRDRAKHAKVIEFGRRLPAARVRVARDLALPGMPRARALALAFRLLDIGFFRVGSACYAEENGSFGLATLLKEHARVTPDGVEFEYIAKGGIERHLVMEDQAVRAAVTTLKRRRGGGPELIAWRGPTGWQHLSSDDINAYLKEMIHPDVSAKDFRTWHATVLAAVELATTPGTRSSTTARKRVITGAMKAVSESLGNTPTVCRQSYVDPRVIDLYNDGVTIRPALARIPSARSAEEDPERRTQMRLERAVVRLLNGADHH